jgi:hypothetical protein
LNVPTMALNKALSKVAEFAPIDLQYNNIDIVRFKKQIRNNTTAAAVNWHFLFFAHRKTPTFFTDKATWTEIYNMSAQFKLATRSEQTRTVLVSPPSERGVVLSPPKKRRCHRVTTPPAPFDIFNDKRTKSLFNVANRDKFVDRVTRMRAAVHQHKLSPFLSMPHKKRKNERLPEYNVLFLFSKLLALTLAYEIVVEKYSAQFSWHDCCKAAVDRMQSAGQTAFNPRAVMEPTLPVL